MTEVIGQVSNPNEVGVFGESALFEGVRGTSHAQFHGGVVGTNDNSTDGAGPGVFGESIKGEGVRGVGHSPAHGGVSGVNDSEGPGVFGESTKGESVRGAGHSPTHGGVVGVNDSAGPGVVGQSVGGAGIQGNGPTGGLFEGSSTAGVRAINLGDGPAVHATAGTGAGIVADGGTDNRNLAGFFNGNVTVVKTITAFDVVISGADCAEDFEITSPVDIEPGTVMAIGEDARLIESYRAYDKCVAGVVSGAGDYKPGIVLGKDASCTDRVPLALIGKVFCKVDATYAPIAVGDLLTTSATRGHAMKAQDPSMAFGAVVGKALASLKEGRSLLPILVALQ